ncbi:MAG: FtsX-like permease family protein [Clostridiaceae bacterium]
MKKTFFKNLLRDIKKTISRFLSIVIIIAVGVSFYAGVRATSPDMKKSGDVYFTENNLMDFKLISTLGLTENDVNEVGKLEGITKVEGSHSIDAVVEKDKKLLVLNINSLPDEDGINDIKIISGRRAESKNEAVVEERFLNENKLELGDTIVLQSGNDSDISDNLENNEFTIVGTAKSPLYLSAQRQLSSVGNGSVRGFVYILPEVFKSEVYSEIYVRTDTSESENSLSYNESYKNVIEGLEENLKGIGTVRGEIRYSEVLDSASEKIKEAEDKLNDAKKEAQSKFADGYRQLEEAKKKIADGKEELKEKEALFNKEITAGKKQIADGKTAIASGEEQINSKALEIEKGKAQIADAKKNLNQGEKQLIQGKQQAASQISAGMALKVAEAKQKMDLNPGNETYKQQYLYINNIYEKDIKGKDFDTMYDSLKKDNALDLIDSYTNIKTLKKNFDKAEAEISYGRSEIAAKEKLLLDGEAKIKAGREEIERNKIKIAEAEATLKKAEAEGIIKLNEGKAKIASGEKEIIENTEKIKSEELKANNQIKDGEDEIQENKDKLQELKKPDWYVLGRSANVGYESYRQDSDRIDNIGKVFPFIFFLVAALVSLTTMTRMVQENRIEIGTFKALGYSRLTIVSHYLIYSLTASVIGSLLGISFGFRLFPPLIMNAYGSLYDLPKAVTFFNTGIAVQASLIAVLFTTLAAVASTLEELREVPASLLRPKPPKSGKRILLERMTFIWRRVSFTKKVTARNIFRYKQRFFMTVIGIGACTGLMITGFGLKAGIIGATENQFNKIYKYDMVTTLTKNVDEDKKNDIKDKIMGESNVDSVLFTYSKNASVKNETSSNVDAYVVVPEEKNDLNNYIELTMGDKALSLSDDGVIITEKLSKLVNKKAGDTIEVTLNDKVIEVKVAAITEHYVQHYIYMSPSYYEKLTSEKLEFNSLYGSLKDTSEQAEEDTSKELKAIDGVNSISFKNNVNVDFNKTVNSINSVVLILIASAGVLAFVVIYNLTNININERRRELATIKLLGFYNNELASYIYRENIILTVIGSFVGVFIGIFINRFVVSTAETNIIMFLKTIDPIYFLYSIILTIVFSIIVNLAMYNRFDKIDMIESLKSAE